MPGVYKEKTCLRCGVKHRKRGAYCCQSCASKSKIGTEKMRENMRRVALEYNRTPEAIAQQRMINSTVTSEDFAVDIPDMIELPDGYDIADDW